MTWKEAVATVVLAQHEVPASLSVEHAPFGALEHVNVNGGRVWDESASTFWFDVLRCTRDERSEAVWNSTNAARDAVGDPPMEGLTWVNVGLQQIHIPTGDQLDVHQAQRLRGEIALTWPQSKMAGLASRLQDRGYETSWREDGLAFVGPFGNKFVAEPVEPAYYGPLQGLGSDSRDMLPGGASEGLGIRAVKFEVPAATPPRICRFYEQVFGATSTRASDTQCEVSIGFEQALVFEVADEVREYEGEHIALYMANGTAFRDSYFRAKSSGIVFHNPRSPQLAYHTYDDVMRVDEFRFKNIVDVDTGNLLYELEHEIRSLDHSGFLLKHHLEVGDGDDEGVPLAVPPALLTNALATTASKVAAPAA